MPFPHRHSSHTRSLISVVSQVLWCFLRVWRGRYKRPFTSRDFIGLWKEKRYRRNMMFLFAGHSAGLLNNNLEKQCFPRLLFRSPAPWLTKEIIFVCTVFLSFTLWMPCERTLIHAQFTLWTAPQNLPIYVMELLVIRWTPMREWQKSIYILKVN